MQADKIFKSKNIYTVTHGMLSGGVAVSEKKSYLLQIMKI